MVAQGLWAVSWLVLQKDMPSLWPAGLGFGNIYHFSINHSSNPAFSIMILAFDPVRIGTTRHKPL